MLRFFADKDLITARIVTDGLKKIYATIEALDFSNLNDDDLASFKMLATDSDNVAASFLNMFLEKYSVDKHLFALNNFVDAFNFNRPESAPELKLCTDIPAAEYLQNITNVLSDSLKEISCLCQLNTDLVNADLANVLEFPTLT